MGQFTGDNSLAAVGSNGSITGVVNVVLNLIFVIVFHMDVAGNSAAQNVEGFVYVAMNAFSQATVAFVSQNLGAGKYERITFRRMCISYGMDIYLFPNRAVPYNRHSIFCISDFMDADS